MSPKSPDNESVRAISLGAVILLALAVHGPLLLMQLPANSEDANTHIFFASHYAQSWFNPWNERWFAGFPQTTYPPLAHQLIATFSAGFGLVLAYMFVELLALLLLIIGVNRYARLWVDERSSAYAAIAAIFLGSTAVLVYQGGQLPMILAAALVLNAAPELYQWARGARLGGLIRAIALITAAAASHHVGAIIGALLLGIPAVLLALLDRKAETAEVTPGGVLLRAAICFGFAALGIFVVLLPYWATVLQNPVRPLALENEQQILSSWLVAYGALFLVLPFAFWRGSSARRLRALFYGWWIVAMLALIGQRWLPNESAFFRSDHLIFWSTLLLLPIVGLFALQLLNNFRTNAVVALSLAAVLTFAGALSWIMLHPANPSPFNSDPVVSFLSRDGHERYRYLTLGFGNEFPRVSTFAAATAVDGAHSARPLPEVATYGALRLDLAKEYGASGMEALRALLKHANQYGLKYIFVRDRFYDPLLAFAGWRVAETYDNGAIRLWTKEDVQSARRFDSGWVPPAWQGILWGTLPIASVIVALLAYLLLPQRRWLSRPVVRAAPEPIVLREAK